MATRCARSGAAGARASRATRRAARSIAASATASRRRASSSTCRCSTTRRRRCSITCRPMPSWPTPPSSAGALTRNWEAIGARHEDRRYDIERPLLDPAELFLDARRGAARHRAIPARRGLELQGRGRRAPAASRTSRPPRRANSASTRAPSGRWRRSRPSSQEFPGRVLLAADSPGRREVLAEMLRGARPARRELRRLAGLPRLDRTGWPGDRRRSSPA